MCLFVRVLGPLDVSLGTEPVTAFESDKVRALLAYLIVESDRPHLRETLAEFFWPDRPPGAALGNLRHALTILRRAIADYQADPPFLLVNRQSIQFNVSSKVWVDSFIFLQNMTRTPDSRAGFDALEGAVSLMRGSFLEGISAGDSTHLEEWLFRKREQFNAYLLHTLNRLITHAELVGEFDLALRYAQQEVEWAPWHEQAYQHAMRLLALCGRRSEALVQFDLCRQRLAEELAVPPSAETVTLYEKIRAEELRPALSELGRQHIRGYELLECIGAGHVGAVYRAHQPVVDRDVAIKIVLPKLASHPEFIRRFEIEARIVARLEHLHIVPLYDFWREPNGAYLVMRWMRGGSLGDKLTHGPLPITQSAELIDQISSALAAAHNQGVIHRDVKPANILLDESGNAYLSDFSIAMMVEMDEHWKVLSPAGPTSSKGYMSPEVVQGEPVTAAADIYSLGVVIYEALTGLHPFPYLAPRSIKHRHLSGPLSKAHDLRLELPAAVDEVIQQAMATEPCDRFADARALAHAFRKALGMRMPPSLPLAGGTVGLPNPYRGLQPFGEADARYFFGRATLTRQLVERLAELTEGARFLAVVGPSGSGKSSVISAGLLPALRRGAVPRSERWYVLQLAPGTNPLVDLGLGLLGIASESLPNLMTILRSGENGLLDVAALVLPDDDSELLLIIDQFEALFDSTVAPQERAQLLHQISTAVNDPYSRVRVVIGLRADYYDRPLVNPAFAHLLGRRTETIGPLTTEELVQAIEGPAIEVGAEIEAGLVATIVADVNEQPGALPVLQYALTELFEHRQGCRLLRESYQAIGGLSGALVQRAESLYGGLLPDEQGAARQLFLRLVSLGEDEVDPVASPVTRRRVLRSELESLIGSGGETAAVTALLVGDSAQATNTIARLIKLFGTARLLTFDREPATRAPTVEVAHEALLWEWPRLRAWLEQNRDHLRTQKLLASAAQEWLAAGKDQSFLLRGTRLDQFAQWAQATDLALTEVEQLYLDSALDQRAKRRDAETARQEHEASLERRSRKFLQTVVGVLTVATVVALSLMAFAFDQRREALEAYSLSLVAHAQQALRNRDTATALALALEANRMSKPPREAQRTLLDAAYAPGARQRYEVASLFPGLKGPATSLDISPDGQTALLGLADGVIILWDWKLGTEIHRLTGHTAKINDVAFGPDGRRAVSGADDGVAIYWDLITGQPIQTLRSQAGSVQSVAVSANGKYMISGGYGGDSFRDPGHLILWDLISGAEIRRYIGHKSGLVAVQFALNDSAILASSGDAELITDQGVSSAGRDHQVETILWDLASGDILARLTSFEHDAYATAISSDGQKALIGSYYDNVASVIDLLTGETVQVLEGHQDAVSAVRFVAGERRALSGSHDGSLILWDLATGEALVQFAVHSGEVSAIAITPDGRSALSATRDGELIIWDLHDAMEIGRFTGHRDMVYDVAHFPDGKRFLSISGGRNPAVHSQDSSVRLWNVASGQQLQSTDLPSEVLFQVDVSPDGAIALVAGMAPMVYVLDATTLAEIGVLEGHEGWVTAVDISPDGQQAATASVDGTLILWDLGEQRLVRRIKTGVEGGLWSVAISPDGRTALADTEDATMGLWDLETGKQLKSFSVEGATGEQGASGTAFLPDGRSAIAQGNNGIIYHWDLQSGELIRILGQHNDIRTRLAVTPDGLLALSSGMDGALMLWNLESGELIRRFGEPGQMIFDIDISPDGQTALSGLSDASIIRWRLDDPSDRELHDWIAYNRYVRDFRCDERNVYQVEPYCPVNER